MPGDGVVPQPELNGPKKAGKSVGRLQHNEDGGRVHHGHSKHVATLELGEDAHRLSTPVTKMRKPMPTAKPVLGLHVFDDAAEKHESAYRSVSARGRRRSITWASTQYTSPVTTFAQPLSVGLLRRREKNRYLPSGLTDGQ
jgi:hypothetical protein